MQHTSFEASVDQEKYQEQRGCSERQTEVQGLIVGLDAVVKCVFLCRSIKILLFMSRSVSFDVLIVCVCYVVFVNPF